LTHYSERVYARCRYAKCRYAGYRVASQLQYGHAGLRNSFQDRNFLRFKNTHQVQYILKNVQRLIAQTYTWV
jgi:hypothetical protein